MKCRDRSLDGVHAVYFFRSVYILKSDQDEEKEANDTCLWFVNYYNLIFAVYTEQKDWQYTPTIDALAKKQLYGPAITLNAYVVFICR